MGTHGGGSILFSRVAILAALAVQAKPCCGPRSNMAAAPALANMTPQQKVDVLLKGLSGAEKYDKLWRLRKKYNGSAPYYRMTGTSAEDFEADGSQKMFASEIEWFAHECQQSRRSRAGVATCDVAHMVAASQSPAARSAPLRSELPDDEMASDDVPEHLRGMRASYLVRKALAQPSAFETLTSFLRAHETLQAVAFSDSERTKLGAIPESLLDRVLHPLEAAPYMQSWSLLGGFGNPSSYAMTAWTNQRLLWVTQYDGRTSLHSAPLSPPATGSTFQCQMPGGS